MTLRSREGTDRLSCLMREWAVTKAPERVATPFLVGFSSSSEESAL